MRILFAGNELGSRTSGQARFLLNLTKGVAALGHETTALVLNTPPPSTVRGLSDSGVRLVSLGLTTSSSALNVGRMTVLNPIGKLLASRVPNDVGFDWIVILSDDAVNFKDEYKGRSRVALISNGDMALLYLRTSFYKQASLLKRGLSLGLSRQILRNGKSARKYDLLLANSSFTRNLMGFLYDTPFQGVVYPPVDRADFRPSTLNPSRDYVLALARNDGEENLSLIEQLGTHVPVKVVGGATIPGCQSEGEVTEADLVRLYSNAAFLAFPATAEPFGYAVAEALSCGTPVMCFDQGGPGEQIDDGVNGWKVRTASRFVPLGRELYAHQELFPKVQVVRETSKRFDVSESAKSLMFELGRGG